MTHTSTTNAFQTGSQCSDSERDTQSIVIHPVVIQGPPTTPLFYCFHTIFQTFFFVLFSFLLTHLGRGRCCKAWSVSQVPGKALRHSEAACRCARDHGSHGRRWTSTDSRVPIHPRLHGLGRRRKRERTTMRL